MFYEVAFFMKIIIVFLIPFIANSQIIINEFMPYPLSGNPEWLELYNPDSINTWSIAALWIEDAHIPLARSKKERVWNAIKTQLQAMISLPPYIQMDILVDLSIQYFRLIMISKFAQYL